MRTAYHMVTDYVKIKHIGQRIYVIHPPVHRHQAAGQQGFHVVAALALHVCQRDTIRSFLVETDTHLSFSGAPGKGAKEAVTSYQVVKSANGFSLLDISIETGRKNQIRVHMKEKGCPVAGDKQYSARTNPIGRLCLHANELSFTHPATGEPVTFKDTQDRPGAGVAGDTHRRGGGQPPGRLHPR